MDTNTARTIVNVYAVLAWVGALFALIAAGALFVGGSTSAFFMPYYGAYNGYAPGMMGFYSGIAIVMGVVMLALAVLYAIGGFGLWQHREWARVLMIVLSVVSLFGFPIGTIIGALGIWLFAFEPTVRGLFRPVAHAR